MGKSPGKWIKTVLFGKKSSKSYLSKDATLDKKATVAAKGHSKDFKNDSMVISSPVPPVIHASGERTELKKTASANLTSNTREVVRSTSGSYTVTEDELIRLEQAATKAQAAFRGYLARRAYWALTGIIRLQALVRGQLVRRQAVATLSCMRAIVEYQALARGRKVRLSGDGRHVLQKYTPGQLADKKSSDLLGRSLRSEKLSTNAFGTRLVASSDNTMPLSLQYDPTEPNSARNWLERWSSSHFWEPIPRLKRVLDAKPKRRQQTKLHAEETETGRQKRNARRVPAANPETNMFNSCESEKQRPTLRKTSSHQVETAPEQSHSELEKVKRSLRKISVSTAAATEKLAVTKPPGCLDKASISPTHSASQQPDLVLKEYNDNLHPVEPPSDENTKTVELNGKVYPCSIENQKTRRRKSFPAKQEHPESTPALPSYMAATESAKAKLRAQAAEDGAEIGFVRRHSLPSSATNKLSLQSPRFQKPLQPNVKTWTKSTKTQISARDDKSGWKR